MANFHHRDEGGRTITCKQVLLSACLRQVSIFRQRNLTAVPCARRHNIHRKTLEKQLHKTKIVSAHFLYYWIHHRDESIYPIRVDFKYGKPNACSQLYRACRTWVSLHIILQFFVLYLQTLKRFKYLHNIFQLLLPWSVCQPTTTYISFQ